MAMNTYDEELQKCIEEGRNPPVDDLDAKGYHRVFKALREEPEYLLSDDFAGKVLNAIEAREIKYTSREYFWFATGILSLLIVFAMAIFLTDFEISSLVFGGLTTHKWLLLFGAGIIGILHWLDRRVINKGA